MSKNMKSSNFFRDPWIHINMLAFWNEITHDPDHMGSSAKARLHFYMQNYIGKCDQLLTHGKFFKLTKMGWDLLLGGGTEEPKFEVRIGLQNNWCPRRRFPSYLLGFSYQTVAKRVEMRFFKGFGSRWTRLRGQNWPLRHMVPKALLPTSSSGIFVTISCAMN